MTTYVALARHFHGRLKRLRPDGWRLERRWRAETDGLPGDRQNLSHFR